jgi:hypothetical protein
MMSTGTDAGRPRGRLTEPTRGEFARILGRINGEDRDF